MTDNPTAKLFTLFAMVLILASPACASSSDFRYVGLTRSQAILKAKQGILALEAAFNGATPAQLASYRKTFDQMRWQARPSRCRGGDHWIKAWAVRAISDKKAPIWVNHAGIVMACQMVHP